MPWATVHQPRKPSSQWTKGRSCTNIHPGPLNGGQPGAIFGYHRAQLEEPSGESRFKQGETDMGDKGKKDKGKKEQQKKALRNLKEKRKQKKEKKK